MMKKTMGIILLALLVIGIVSISGCADKKVEQNNTNNTTSTQHVYVVGTEPYFPPFESADKNSSGKIVGFDVDLIEAIAAN